jgi:hypothetical protein
LSAIALFSNVLTEHPWPTHILSAGTALFALFTAYSLHSKYTVDIIATEIANISQACSMIYYYRKILPWLGWH